MPIALTAASSAQYQQNIHCVLVITTNCINTDFGSYVNALLPHSCPTSVAYPIIVPECGSSVMQCPMLCKQMFNMPLDQSLGVEAHRTIDIKLNKYAHCKRQKTF